MRPVFALAVPLVVLVGCAGGPDATPATQTVTVTATVTAEPTEEAEPDAEADIDVADDAAEAPASGGTGSRSAPLAAGSTVTLGDWEVTIRKTNPHATAEILEENMFNDEPGDGSTFAMAPVDLTYVGEDSGTPWVGLMFRLVGGDGNTYGDGCGVIPSSLNDVSEMYTDASASGNVCAEILETALDGAAWRVTESFSFDDAEAWFDLTE